MSNPLHTFATDNADVNLAAGATIFSEANASGVDRWVTLDIKIGDGTKDLTADSETTLTFQVSNGGVEGGEIEATVPNAQDRYRIQTDPILWVNGETLALSCISSNAGDTDVDCTVAVRDAAPLQSTTSDRTLGVESDGHGHADLKQWKGSTPADLADTDKVPSSVQHMADNVITSAATHSGYITELANEIEAAIANDADMTAVVQTIADRIAADWVAGDSSPLAIVAALKADAEWSDLATIQSNLTMILTRLVGTIAAGTHQPQGGDAHAIVSSGTHGNAALLTQLGTLATSAALALVKAVTDKLDTALVLDGAVYKLTENALEEAPTGGGGGSGTVIINVVPSIVDGGEVLSGPIVAYVDSIDTRTIIVEDSNGEPIDLSAEPLTFHVMTKPLEGSGEAPVTVFTLTTGGSGITVGGAGNNQVAVTWSRADTALANEGEHEFSLRSTSGANAGKPWGHGPYSLRYIPPLPTP